MLKKFPLLFLVLLIEGGALMAVELMGAKLVAPFYGSSLYVWTAVLAITVFGLTLGYYIGGRLSRNRPSETKLFVILGISALLVLALPGTASLCIGLTKGMGLIPGICVTCFLLLVPPMLCFGIVGPMVVSLMSSQIETVGKTAGTVYFTSTFGGIGATFFFGLYFIPVAGLRLCATLTGLMLAALPVLYFLQRFFKKDNVVVTGLRPVHGRSRENDRPQGGRYSKEANKRRNQPLRTTKRTIYLFAAVEGATVMAVELISARMVAPYFGSSLYVWATIIGFTLLALAIGYVTGGIVADKYSSPQTILWLLLIASLFLMLMHVFASLLTIALADLNPAVAIIFVSMALILPPLVFLGMVPTFLVRRVSAMVDHAGRSTGTVYAISSASGIVALPLFGFFIIPRFGLTVPSIVTGLLVGLIPFIRLIARKKYTSLSFIVIALFSFSAIKTQLPSKAVDVKYYSEGLLGQLLVADVSSERLLFLNRIIQTGTDITTANPKWDYVYFAYSLCSKLPEKSDALLLGLGGGTIANVFQNKLRFNVVGVELDERMAEVARQYFGLTNDVKVFVDDARHYLEEDRKKYDLIFFDIYRGESPPPHVFTTESLAKTKDLLNEDGLIIVNFNGYLEGKTGIPARSIYKTLRAAGLEARILPTPGAEANRNLLFVASKKKQDFRQVRSPLLLNGQKADIETLFLQPRDVDINDAVVLTDNQPILELLNIRAGNAWRKAYAEMTRTFYNEGVPLFK